MCAQVRVSEILRKIQTIMVNTFQEVTLDAILVSAIRIIFLQSNFLFLEIF